LSAIAIGRGPQQLGNLGNEAFDGVRRQLIDQGTDASLDNDGVGCGRVQSTRLLLDPGLDRRTAHTDLAARWLRSKGQGYYTIGSSGHESNAAVAMALRPTDPALLHYRSGGFYLARSGVEGVRDILSGVVAASDEPIAGGRHKVFGRHDLAIIPQTSTIASHLPRAVGVAFAIGRALMGNPVFILMDEPMEGLAPVIVDAVLDGLERLKKEGDTALMLVEQHARLALDFAEDTIVLDRGRIVFSGPSRELAAAPDKMAALLGVAGR
jgi:hypothetical protein